jgi:hypothetical protein
MRRRRYKSKEIVANLTQVDVLVSRGQGIGETDQVKRYLSLR